LDEMVGKMSDPVQATDPTGVCLTVEAPFEELDPVLREACGAAGDGAGGLAGFRAGRLPFLAIDQKAGAAVLPRAVEQALMDLVGARARESGVSPLGRAGVEILECGADRPLRFTAAVDVKPPIALPDVTAISVTAAVVTVTDEDVEEVLGVLRQRRITWQDVERPAAEGDLITMDLRAHVNGTPVPGASASAVTYELGSGRPLAALDPGVVGYGHLPAELDLALPGTAAGHTVTVTSRLVGGPFQGADAEVTITPTKVQAPRLPDIDDRFAQDTGAFADLDHLRRAVRDSLHRDRTSVRAQSVRAQALDQLAAAANVPAPAGLVADEVEHRYQWMTSELIRLGSSLGRYLEEQGQSEQEVVAQLRGATVQRVRGQIVLDAFADQEEVDVSDREIESAAGLRARQAGLPTESYVSQLAHMGGLEELRNDVRRGKSLAVLLQRITIADEYGNPVSFHDVHPGDPDTDTDRLRVPSAPATGETAG
jgi:trigger factor